jgi:deoxyribonuclease-4
MNIGAHVKGGGNMIPALEAGAAIGATSIQIFNQIPRQWRLMSYSDEAMTNFREANANHPTVNEVFCHAQYLINMGSPDKELLAKSIAALSQNITVGRAMGSAGVVVHTGSHMGEGFEKQLKQVAQSYVKALDKAKKSPKGVADCPLLIENTAGAGGTIGRSFEEIGAIIDATDGDERIGVCIDTQHLWASGFDFSTVDGAHRLVAEIDKAIGLKRLKCFHLNDSIPMLGANRDRHANIDEGTIGAKGLAALMGHPAMRDLPMILEVPGDGDGPRESDVKDALKAWKKGVAMYDKTSAQKVPAKKSPAAKKTPTKK